MKAFEARKASVEPQYEAAMEEIDEAVGWGWKSTHVCHSHSLYPEVAERIAKEGFDVKIVLRADDSMSYNEVSWEHAEEEGREGTITYVDETKPKMPSELEIFAEFLGMGKSTSHEEEVETETENDSEADN